MKDWHLKVRVGAGEWHDLGTHPCPEDVEPRDYFTLDVKFADEEARFTWNIVYESEDE